MPERCGHVWSTTTATAALAEGRSESGVGRWEEQYLGPYHLGEWLDLRGGPPPLSVGPDLAATLESVARRPPELDDLTTSRRALALIGGFPELIDRLRGEDLEQELLESQRVLRADAVERAVYKDIPQSFGVDNPLLLERLLYVLAGQVAGVLSPTRICRQLGFGQPTFDRYVSYLERAFLIFTLTNYSGQEARRQRRGRKLCFVDSAVRNAALQRGLAPLRDRVEMGHL